VSDDASTVLHLLRSNDPADRKTALAALSQRGHATPQELEALREAIPRSDFSERLGILQTYNHVAPKDPFVLECFLRELQPDRDESEFVDLLIAVPSFKDF